jgi:polyhydroxyalkanoate synthesis regulator phasin
MVDENEKYSLMKRAAEIELNQGKKFPSDLVRFTFMEKALAIYREMQDTININQEETQRLIDDLKIEMKKINLESEMKVISSSISLAEIISKFENALKKDSEHILSGILLENYGLIDITEAMTQAIAQKKEFPLQFILPVKVIGNDGVIRTHSSEESILDYKARTNITLGVKVTGSVLGAVFDDLKKEISSSNELNEILAHPAICDIKPIIERGIKAILGEEKDPIIASHLLVPYMEEIIRRVVVSNGLTDSVVGWERQLGTEEKSLAIKSTTLGGLLDNADVRQILGTKFSDSLKTFLIDLDQVNYRNLLLHGLMNPEDITYYDTSFVAYSILRLIRMLPKVSVKS